MIRRRSLVTAFQLQSNAVVLAAGLPRAHPEYLMALLRRSELSVAHVCFRDQLLVAEQEH